MALPIDDIRIERAAIAPFTHKLVVESNGYKYEGYFDNNLSMFAQCVTEALRYIASSQGVVAPGPDRSVKRLVDGK